MLVNVALFAWQHGVFGRFAESGREPERIARQVEPERIRVLSEREVQVLRERAAAQSRAAAVAAPPSAANGAGIDLSVAQACVEFGDFIGPDLSRVETALLKLGLGSRQSARTVEVPGWYLVYLPPFKTRAEADRAVAELKKSGVKDLLVFTDGPLRLGVSLGSFRDPELAKAHVASLVKLGVKNARVSDKPTAVSADAPADARTRRRKRPSSSAAIAKEFPSQSVRACSAG